MPVEKIIHANPFRFKKAYPPRYVNNIYLDSPLFRNFLDSTSGNARRQKVRIRWYGELFGDATLPALEIKEKSGLVSWKNTYSLPPFSFVQGGSKAQIMDLLKNANLPEEILSLIGTQAPVLVNRYHRAYYLSHDTRFRLTLDSDMEFRSFKKFDNRFLLHRKDHITRIMELKYAPEHDDFLTDITQFLPFRFDRFSKYITGMDLVYDHLHAMTY